jgi:CTP:phosphocholine cytidylyltransferase-like protein
MSRAIRPDKIQSPYLTRTEQAAEERGNTQEEIILSDISYTDGWSVLTDEMDRIIDELEGSLAEQMAAGADFADIGKTAVVKEIVKSYMVRIKNKVLDAREAVKGGK